jgi:nitrogen fixation protein NifX
MTQTAPISRELALRIGLAARELPDTAPRVLIEVLIDCVGHPLTEQKLVKLTVKELKTAADGALNQLPAEALKAALHQLKDGLSNETDDLPSIMPYAEGDMPASIRVACASNTEEQLDGHFGSCARFLVYQVSSQEARLIAIRSTAGDAEAEDKNAFRSELIRDCDVLYVGSIGGPAAAKVVKMSIHPIKVPQGGAIADLLVQLKTVLAGSPPPWLAKVMGASPEERRRFSVDAVEED